MVGGAELQQILLAKNLVKKGFAVSFIVYDHGQQDKEIIDGITIIKCFPSDYSIVDIVIKGTIRFWQALSKADADIYYHEAAYKAAGITSVFCLIHKRKYMQRIASDRYADERYKAIMGIKSCLYRFAIRKADCVMVENEYQRNGIRQNFSKDSIIVKSLVDFPNLQSNKRIEKPPIVLWVGKIDHNKQPYLFLKLAESIPYARFKLIGGPDDEEYYQEIRRLSQGFPNLEFLGFIPYHKVNQYFNQASICVNTSIVEGFPNTFLQAWCRRIPVVSLNVDPDEIICEFKMGFHSRSFEKMVEDVELLLVNDKLREEMGCNGRNYCITKHDNEAIIDGIVNIFKKVTSQS
jgi:glycosyltransferase involved in cell wall biosynthesis